MQREALADVAVGILVDDEDLVACKGSGSDAREGKAGSVEVPTAMLIEVLPPSGEVAETNSQSCRRRRQGRNADPGLAGTQPDGHPTQRFPEVRRRQR